MQAQRGKDPEREARIAFEAVVDAYNEGERAISWYYYLDSKLEVPFKARCRQGDLRSPLQVDQEIEVQGMAPQDLCEHDMLVLIDYAGCRLGVPLSQLEPLTGSEETLEAVHDWHYWVGRGYEF